MNKLFLLLSIALILGTGCKTSSPGNPSTISPIKDIGCAVETTISGQFGSTLAGATGAADPVACGAAIQLYFGNFNLCTTPIPAPSPASLAVNSLGDATMRVKAMGAWKTIGDITKGDLQSVRVADVATSGIVGSIVCPLADALAIGALSSQIPPACQGPKSLSAGAVNQMLIAACIAVIPI